MRELIFQHPSFDNGVKLSHFGHLGRLESFRTLDLTLTELLVQGLHWLAHKSHD